MQIDNVQKNILLTKRSRCENLINVKNLFYIEFTQSTWKVLDAGFCCF